MEGLCIESHEDLLYLLDSIEDEITRSMTTAANNIPEGLELLSAKLDRLCEFIVCEENEKRWKQWGSRADIRKVSERLRETSAKALCVVEKMRSLRTYTEKWDVNLYISLLSASVKEEWRYAQIDRTAKVLFIGAGAFPMSAFTIARETSAEVMCTDIDDEAVRHGRKLAQFLGLQRTVHYSGSHLRNPEFLRTATHVFIASLVPEKLEILEELKSVIHPDCKVIIRYGNGLKSLFNYPLDINLLKEWQVKSMNRDKCIYDTFILELQKTAARSAL